MAGKTVGEKHIRVLIADASGFVRMVLRDIFSSIPEVEVVATALSGGQAIKLLKIHQPDVLLMDLNLPQNTRWFTLQRIAHECPVPVLIMNSTKSELSSTEMAQLRTLGAYGFVNMPANILKPQLRTIKEELVQKLYDSRHLSLASVKAIPGDEKLPRPVLPSSEGKAVMHISPAKVIVVGASTGGTRQIEMLLQWLEPTFMGCLLIAVHLPETFAKTFVNRLKSITSLKVSLARSGTLLEAGRVIVAPGGRDMYVEAAASRPGLAKVMLTKQSASSFDSPSIDRLMASAAAFFKTDAIGIILTGMGSDGTAGLAAISEKGGDTIVQDQHKAGVFGMAKSALNKGVAHQVLTVPQMVTFIEQQTAPGNGRPAGNKLSGS